MAELGTFLLAAACVGICATAVMDAWLSFQARVLRVAPMDFALLGRWVGHLRRGQLRHERIAASTPVAGERMLGWIAHYAVGIGLASVLLASTGVAWLCAPNFAPALAVGAGSVALPFLVLQPAMGAGIAAGRSPRPAAARLRSIFTHTVFGVGLYAGGWFTHLLGIGIQ